MASTIWKGHLTFGLVSIPVKLNRAARAERVSFRQLHASSGARVRQALVAESAPEPEPESEEPEVSEVSEERTWRQSAPARAATAALAAPARTGKVREEAPPSPPVTVQPPRPFAVPAPAAPQSREISRSEIVKGFEYAPNQYVTLTKDELAGITPQTAREAQILEFVKLAEVDPIYFETSYYVVPDKGGERAYSLLFDALRQSALVGVAQLAMHNREHVVIVRPGRRGLILHTMFYQDEIRERDEFHAETKDVSPKELELALLLVRNLEAPFEPAKYHDTYREKLDALIQDRISGNQTVQPPQPKQADVVNILEALQRSLESAGSNRKPPVTEEKAPARPQRKRSGGAKS